MVSVVHWTHLPIVVFVEVQTKPTAQLLPPAPRQPGSQFFVISLQT